MTAVRKNEADASSDPQVAPQVAELRERLFRGCACLETAIHTLWPHKKVAAYHDFVWTTKNPPIQTDG